MKTPDSWSSKSLEWRSDGQPGSGAENEATRRESIRGKSRGRPTQGASHLPVRWTAGPGDEGGRGATAGDSLLHSHLFRNQRASSGPSSRGTLGTVEPKGHGDALLELYHLKIFSILGTAPWVCCRRRREESITAAQCMSEGSGQGAGSAPTAAWGSETATRGLQEVPAGPVSRRCAWLHSPLHKNPCGRK